MRVYRYELPECTCMLTAGRHPPPCLSHCVTCSSSNLRLGHLRILESLRHLPLFCVPFGHHAQIIELSAFALKYVLYLPPEHPLNSIR